MKLFGLIFFIVFSTTAKCSVVLSNKTKTCDRLACAFDEIINSIAERRREISIVNFGNDSKIVNSIVPKESNLTFKVLNRKAKKMEINYMNDSGILIFDSVQNLKDFNELVLFTNRGPQAYEFFIYCQNAKFKDIESLVEGKAHKLLHLQYFLIDEKKSLKLLTFIWYSPETCDKKQLIEVNSFDKKTKTWRHETFTIRKFDNFFGCSLVFKPNRIDREKHYNKALKKLLLDLSKILNFTYKVRTNETKGYLVAALMCYQKICPYDNCKDIVSYPFVSTFDYLAVPSGELLSGYEKLLLPFDVYVMVMIVVTFVAAFTTILIISYTNDTIRNFVFGRNVRSPVLNVVRIFFGDSQTILPRRNFARFLLIVYLFYCLIIRTAWQGKLFEFLQKEIRKRQVTSTDEMVETGMEIHLGDYQKLADYGKWRKFDR
jgi:hypothetical protein